MGKKGWNLFGGDERKRKPLTRVQRASNDAEAVAEVKRLVRSGSFVDAEKACKKIKDPAIRKDYRNNVEQAALAAIKA